MSTTPIDTGIATMDAFMALDALVEGGAMLPDVAKRTKRDILAGASLESCVFHAWSKPIHSRWGNLPATLLDGRITADQLAQFIADIFEGSAITPSVSVLEGLAPRRV